MIGGSSVASTAGDFIRLLRFICLGAGYGWLGKGRDEFSPDSNDVDDDNDGAESASLSSIDDLDEVRVIWGFDCAASDSSSIASLLQVSGTSDADATNCRSLLRLAGGGLSRMNFLPPRLASRVTVIGR